MKEITNYWKVNLETGHNLIIMQVKRGDDKTSKFWIRIVRTGTQFRAWSGLSGGNELLVLIKNYVKLNTLTCHRNCELQKNLVDYGVDGTS